jgi:hypothetical protein
VRFCWISVKPSGGARQTTAPIHRHYRQCFQAFYEYFPCPTCPNFSWCNSLNGWLLGLARYKNSLPKPRPCLFEGIAEVGLEIALVNVPHRIRALRLPPRALAVTSQERGAAQEGLGSGTIASYSVAIPAAMIANTSCKPGNSWFQKSAPIEYFYRFLCRALLFFFSSSRLTDSGCPGFAVEL